MVPRLPYGPMQDASMQDDPMTIAIDAGPLYGHRTGVGVATAGMFTALAETAGIRLAPYLVSGRSTPQPGHRRLPVPGIAASHLWSRWSRPAADRWLGDADLVHGTNYVAPPTKLPTVVSVYDCWFLQHPDQASSLVRRAGENLRRAVGRGAWVHTTSDATAAAARDLLATDRVVTVHLGPPPDGPDPAPPAHQTELGGVPYVLSLGTEERRKDVVLVIEAFRELVGDHPELLLVLAGARGDDSDRITSAIEAAGPIGSRIRRLGQVDDPVKQWLLRHASVLAYPSRDEGFGFPILEANALGTPVVATAVGAIPEVAGDAAVLIDGADRRPTALAAAISSAISGPQRLGLIEAGYRNVRRFSWERTAAGLIELYRTAQDSR
jgi:glycosyltransferase involved in cell wall biosynthesis